MNSLTRTVDASLTEAADCPASTADCALPPGEAEPGEVSILSVTTLMLWLLCLGVGLAGLLVPYSTREPSPRPVPPLNAELLNVELTSDPVAVADETPAPLVKSSEPPPLLPTQIPPEAPALIPVAEPAATVAFALPVEGPTRAAPAAHPVPAARSERSASPSAPSLTVQTLAFGQGEGKQPAPDYPPRARRDGQEGTVVVRLSVGENGRVLGAEAAAPSPWPLLNEAAVTAVRQRWRFRSGALRLYEVAIRFELTK